MHITSPLARTAHSTRDAEILTADGCRYLIDDDPERTVVRRLPDGSAVRMPFGEFLHERRLAAQDLRQAESARCWRLLARWLRGLGRTRTALRKHALRARGLRAAS